MTRPGFVHGIAALAASDEPVPHLPSIERWRQGDRKRPYDPNVDASRQEMRSFVCGQCHVEYYCGTKKTLYFPWDNGLQGGADRGRRRTRRKFPDGTPFYDFEHGETGAKVYKAQHPEFELWSQGIHARSGVSCCRLPHAVRAAGGDEGQQPLGAQPAAEHQQRLPDVPQRAGGDELRDKWQRSRSGTMAQIERAATAMTDMLDAILEAKAAGADDGAARADLRAAAEGDVAARLHQQRELAWLPRRPGGGADPGRVDRLQPAGAGAGAAIPPGGTGDRCACRRSRCKG